MFEFLKRLFRRKPASRNTSTTTYAPPPRPANPWPPVPAPGYIKAEQSRQKRMEDELALRRLERGPHTPVPRAHLYPASQSIGRGTRTTPASPAPRPYDDSMDMSNPLNPLSPLSPMHSPVQPWVDMNPAPVHEPMPAPTPSYECPAPSPSYESPACSPPPMDFGSSSGTDSSGW